jgi:hypothetical protein
MSMHVRRTRVDGVDYYRIIEAWRERGKLRNRHVVSLGTISDPAAALAAKKRRFVLQKRRRARLRPGQVKARQRIERSLSRLAIEIAKVEMFLGGPRLLVVAGDGIRFYQRR